MSAHETIHAQVTVDPLVLTVPAAPAQRIAAFTIDIAVTVSLVAAGILCAGFGAPAGAWVLLSAAAVFVGGSLVALALTGRTLGALAAGIRSVERASAATSGGRLPADILTGRLRTFDLRRGRDPLAPALASFRFPEQPANAAAPPAPRRGELQRPAIVTLDSGQRLPLESTLVLGRSPVATPDAPSPVFQWLDLSRTLSKSHARLEWDGRRTWITDLGSTNGTALRTTAGDQPLIAHQRTPLPPVAVLALGDRLLTIAVPA